MDDVSLVVSKVFVKHAYMKRHMLDFNPNIKFGINCKYSPPTLYAWFNFIFYLPLVDLLNSSLL